MSKRTKCRRCRMAAIEPEHLYERGDGRWLCMPCIVLLVYEAEAQEINRQSDAAMSRHARHIQPSMDCPFCAYGVV